MSVKNLQKLARLVLSKEIIALITLADGKLSKQMLKFVVVVVAAIYKMFSHVTKYFLKNINIFL